eukprot:TRINITY_DN23786_c0_g1_i5.p1 TRINITY_DN23786_c0_g1~~TRINITY_DN23786_c0_g1_i5.p1  ORF type:complete len:769 (+),score=102.81 TRINITY_DN23786_c0_g1_i5:103-2409(+)
MGCCGGRCSDDPSDAQGEAGPATAKVPAAGAQGRPGAEGASAAVPAELRGACKTTGTPAASTRSAPYGGPDDEQCEGARAEMIEAWPGCSPSPPSSPSPAAATAKGDACPGGREASPRAPDGGTESSPRSSTESIAVLEVTTVCQSPPRDLLSCPEQGGPLHPLPPPRRPPESTAAKQSPRPDPPVAAIKTRAPQPPVVPEKRTLVAKIRALPGALGRQRLFAPAVLRRPGGPRAKDARSCNASRPVVAPVPPRKAARPVRPTRPVPPGAAPRPARAPQTAQVQVASGVTASTVHPQQAPLHSSQPPPEPSPRPPIRQTVGSRRGSTSAEGTTPGHSPSPEHSPVRCPGAPVRNCEPSPAAHQEEEKCASSDEDVEYMTPRGDPRGDRGDFHSGPEGHRQMVPGADVHGYTVQRPLGRGAFGAVWLATSRRAGAVAIKVSRSGSDYRKECAGEIQTLEAIDAFARSIRKKNLKLCRERIVATHCSFELPGRAGARHQALVLEALGPSLEQLAEHHDGRCVAPPIVKAIVRQLLQALEFLAEMGMCHGDLKLENILLSAQSLRPTGTAPCKGGARAADLLQGKHRRLRGESLAQGLMRNYAVKIVDFGKAVRCRDEELEWPIQTLPYRAPEVVCGAWEVSPAADVWSAGCICVELLVGDYLFSVSEQISNGLESNQRIWATWVETLGRPPCYFFRPEEYEFVQLYIDDCGRPVEQIQTRSRPLQQRLQRSAAADCPLSSMMDFILAMLKYCPEERVRPQDARRHRWLQL